MQPYPTPAGTESAEGGGEQQNYQWTAVLSSTHVSHMPPDMS